MSELLSFKNGYDTAINILFELRNTVKSNTSLKCKVEYIYPNSQIETYFGYTDVGNTILFIPNLCIIKFFPKPYYRMGIKTFYVSANQEDTLDFDKLKALCESVSIEAVMQWKYLRTWQEVKLKEVGTTLNLNALDNKYAGDFATRSFSVISTQVMRFLEETKKSVLIMAMLCSALIGGFIISLGYLILIIIILIILVVTHVIG